MEKRYSVLVVFSALLVSIINLVSAQYYGSNIFGYIFDTIGPQNLTLMAIFFILGVVLSFALKKSFGGTGGMLGWLIAFFITGAAHFSGFDAYFDFSNIFYSIGLSEETLAIGIPLVVLLITGVLAFKHGLGVAVIAASSLIFGLVFVVGFGTIDFGTIITILIVWGIIILIGLWMIRRRAKKKAGLIYSNPKNYSYSSPNLTPSYRNQRSANSGPGLFRRTVTAPYRGYKATSNAMGRAGAWTGKQTDKAMDATWKGAKTTGRVLGTGRIKWAENAARKARDEYDQGVKERHAYQMEKQQRKLEEKEQKMKKKNQEALEKRAKEERMKLEKEAEEMEAQRKEAVRREQEMNRVERTKKYEQMGYNLGKKVKKIGKRFRKS